MASHQLILSAVFICVFSTAVLAFDRPKAEVAGGRFKDTQFFQNGKEAPANSSSVDSSTGKPPKEPTLGVAEIQYYREGTICSGVHLKPWIILTVADCVQGRDVKKVYLNVTTASRSVPVQVDSITFHPDYERGEPNYNIALLLVYAQFDWDVKPFKLTFRNYTTKDILKKELKTFVNEWLSDYDDGFVPVSLPKMVTEDYSLCGSLGYVIDWYCVETENKNHQVNVGTPLYYESGNDKKFLGICTGKQLGEHSPGHLFQSIYPSVYWVAEFVKEHPVPPE